MKYDTGRVKALTTGPTEKFFYFNRKMLFAQGMVLLIVSALIAFALFSLFSGGNVQESGPGGFRSVDLANWSSAQGELFPTGSFSNDGKFVAFDSSKSGSMSIWVKQTGAGEAFEVTKGESFARYPVWSPNDDYLAYYSKHDGNHGIWRIPFTGGSPEPVATAEEPEPRLRLWSKSGKIYYQGSYNLFSVDVRTGAIAQVTKFEAKGVPAKIIAISRDEENVAFLTHAGNKWVINVSPLGAEEESQIISSENEISDMVWHPDGRHLFYSANINGFYQVFQVDSVLNNRTQISFQEKDSHVLAAASDGSAILIGSANEESDLWRVNVETSEETVVASDIAAELWPNVAPDSDKLVFQFAKNMSQANKLLDSSIVTKKLDGADTPVMLAERGYLPQWSPVGNDVGFLRFVGGEVEIWKVEGSGGGLKRLAKGGIPNIGYSVSPYLTVESSYFQWSPVEELLAYTATRDGASNLRTVTADGSNDTRISANTDPETRQYSPFWSPNGKQIAFLSKKRVKGAPGSAEYRIRLYDFDEQTEKDVFQSSTGLRLLGWSETGDELIFAAPFQDQSVYLVNKEVLIHGVSLDSGRDRVITTLKDTYLYNIFLSPERRSIAFTSRVGSNDEVWVLPTSGGEPRRLTKNSDPRLNFSSLAWSPDSKSIVFGKQSRFSLLSMIVNMKKTEEQDE